MMNSRTGIDKKNIAVAVPCIVVILATLGAVGTGGRQRAKRIVCMMNVQRLTAAWLNYASDNDDKLVNGEAGISYTLPHHPGENAWVGRCWGELYNQPRPPGVPWPIESQIQSIKGGALWGHTGETRIYACPDGEPGEMLTYNIMDGANGRAVSGTYNPKVYTPKAGPDGSLLWVKKWTQIARPASRLVFIDEGYATPDSFAVHWENQYGWWWDDPPAGHNGGTVVSFADGHVADHKWKGRITVLFGLKYADYKGPNLGPTSQFGLWSSAEWEDLYFVHNGCWGQTHPDFPWRPGDD